MVIDTSALVAMVVGEPEVERFSRAVEVARQPSLSAASYLEAGIVLGPIGRTHLPRFLAVGGIEVRPVDLDQARLAVEAHERYGQGSGSPARLNFGDCFSYALAVSLDESLLFKGSDFVHTDVRVAEW